jgi:hypothetical protein
MNMDVAPKLYGYSINVAITYKDNGYCPFHLISQLPPPPMVEVSKILTPKKKYKSANAKPPGKSQNDVVPLIYTPYLGTPMAII